MEPFIKLYRKFLDWEWYSDINTSRLFVHILLKANWKPGQFKGTSVERGELVSSLDTLSRETGLSVNEIRTALKHLKSTGELTSKSHTKFTVFTVVKYDSYQQVNKQDNEQITSESHSINRRLTTIEEVKKKEVKKKDIKSIVFTPPTVENVIGYCNENGYKIDAERFIDFYSSKGWMVGKNKMKDWKAAVRNWCRSEKEPKAKPVTANKFNNFEQRQYDYEALEKQLLNS